jgi:hypothetical protein
MTKYIVREKFATIREAEVEADSAEEAIDIARGKAMKLFPDDAALQYAETEFDAYDPNSSEAFAVGSTADWQWEVERPA